MLKISASFDDGSIEDLETAELMDKYGIDTVFYIPVNWRKYNSQRGVEPLTEEQVEDIAERHEIGAHGVNHMLLTRVPAVDVMSEIYTPKKWWAEQGIPVTKFCYPRGYYNEDIKRYIKEAGYAMARTTRICELFNRDPFETHTTVHVGVNRKEYGTDWLTYAEKILDEALARVDEDPHYHFWGHSIEIKRNGEWDRFLKFLEYLDERTHR